MGLKKNIGALAGKLPVENAKEKKSKKDLVVSNETSNFLSIAETEIESYFPEEVKFSFEIAEDIKKDVVRLGKGIKFTELKSRILLGNLYQEAYDKLAGVNHHDNGRYDEWLQTFGLSKATAWRYRRRLMIHNLFEGEKAAQKVIEKTTDAYIEKIHGLEDKTELIRTLIHCPSKQELKEYFYNKEEAIAIDNDVSLKTEYNQFIKDLRKVNVYHLSNEKQDKLKEYMEAIEELIK